MGAAPHINISAHYASLAELKAASPTLADGLSEAQEGILRREQYRTVLNAGRRLNLCGAACHMRAVVCSVWSALACHSATLACVAHTQVTLHSKRASRELGRATSHLHAQYDLCLPQARQGPRHGDGVHAPVLRTEFNGPK